jgi:hypothetical protein
MKTNAPLLAKIALGFATIVILVAAAPRASAVPVTFSGGNGAALSFSLSAPVTYTITTNPTGVAPFFIFQNVGTVNFFSAISSSITFSVNGGPDQTLLTAQSGIFANDVNGADLILGNPFLPLNIGDVVVLSAGTWTTISGYFGVTPANGSFNTFLTDSFLLRISTDGISGSAPVPESLSTLWLALPLVGMLGARRRWLRLPA